MNVSTIVTLILTAIAAIAMMVPGLNALEGSIRGLQETKIKEAEEYCYSYVARQKVRPNEVDSAQEECVGRESDRVTKSFKPALDIIDTFRKAIGAEGNSAASAASAASGSSGTP